MALLFAPFHSIPPQPERYYVVFHSRRSNTHPVVPASRQHKPPMNKRVRKLMALAVGGCLLCNIAVAKDQLIDWSFSALPQNHEVDVLQCQSVVFEWTNNNGDGVLHSVWKFPDEGAYNDCDFSNAKELSAASAASGSYALENDDTLDVTKRWFG